MKSRVGSWCYYLGAFVFLLFIVFVWDEVKAEDTRGIVYIGGSGITRYINTVTCNAIRDAENEEENITTQEEIELLARLITAEQGYGASEQVYYLTGSVVINRINSDEFPNTLWEVIYDPGQYEPTWNGSIYNEYDEVAWEIAEGLLVYGTDIPENVVYQAEFVQGSDIYDIQGNTYFCYR